MSMVKMKKLDIITFKTSELEGFLESAKEMGTGEYNIPLCSERINMECSIKEFEEKKGD